MAIKAKATNGITTEPLTTTTTTATPTIPPVVGINFGNSYASIGVFTKEGLAECIANEDGERQIASVVSFHGGQIYVGNQAKQQLVKNARNTVVGFRNFVGKRFSEIPEAAKSTTTTTSAPVIEHPEQPDVAAYRVEVLASPSPTPQQQQNRTNSTPTTPAPEPQPTERILTVSDVTTIFLDSLIQSAENFLGKKVKGAVITVPQMRALEGAVTGVKVYQFLEEAGAVLALTSTELWTGSGKLNPDRTQLYVDLGDSSLSLHVVVTREGLGHVLGSYTTASIGASQIDDRLVGFFAGDFTKKTKVPLTDGDARAQAKLRLAIEHVKRTLSASPGAATLSIESLKDGYDYTGSINKMRFDMLAKPVYAAVAAAVTRVLGESGVDAHEVDEIVYVGGTSSLPGLGEEIVGAAGGGVQTAFSMGRVGGGGLGDPTTVLARGAAIQAALLFGLQEEEQDLATEPVEVAVLSRSVALWFPPGTLVPLVLKESQLPTRRTTTIEVALTEDSKAFGFELWEVEESVRVEKVKPPKVEYSDDESEEEEEEVEEKHREVKKVTLLGAKTGEAKLGIKTKGKGADAGKWFTTVEAAVIVSETGAVQLTVKELGEGGEVLALEILCHP